MYHPARKVKSSLDMSAWGPQMALAVPDRTVRSHIFTFSAPGACRMISSAPLFLLYGPLQVVSCHVVEASSQKVFFYSQGSPPGGPHGSPPVLVYAGKALSLRGQLLIDVFRIEDRLQVQPVALHSEPLVDNLAHYL